MLELEKLSSYLHEFYKNRDTEFRHRIIVQSMPMTLNILNCQGAESMLALHANDKKELMRGMQTEMSAFTTYLRSIIEEKSAPTAARKERQ